MRELRVGDSLTMRLTPIDRHPSHQNSTDSELIVTKLMTNHIKFSAECYGRKYFGTLQLNLSEKENQSETD